MSIPIESKAKRFVPFPTTFIPSSTSIDVSNDDDDSIDITPSRPIFSIAAAKRFPTKLSFPADIAATAEGIKV